MSALTTSSGVAGRPSFGGATWAAMAMPAAKTSAAPKRTAGLDIDVAHLAIGRDRPALYGAEMEVLARRILRRPFGVGLLNAAFLIGRTAHQHHRLPIPHPGQTEPRQGLGENWRGEGCLGPALAAVGGDVDAPHPTQARPGEAGNLVIAWPLHAQAERRLHDHRFRLHLEHEFARPAVGQELGVARGLVTRIHRRVDHFATANPFDVGVAFEARHQQPHLEALLRTAWFAT